MKRVVMPVRWQCANTSVGIVEISPVPGAGDLLPRLSFLVLRCNRHRTGLGVLSAYRHRFSNIQGDQIVQITEPYFQSRWKSGVLFSRRWITGASAGRPLHTPFGRRKHQRTKIHAFCTSFYRQVHERITERITRPVQHHRWYYAGCGNNMESNNAMPVAAQPDEHLPSTGRATVDEECSQRVDLLQQTWR